MLRAAHRSPKLDALADALEIPVPYAVGILERLWWITAESTPSGAIGELSDGAIARRIGLPNAVQLIDALVSSGWLDRDATHRLVVHDWSEHADRHVHRALAANGERFADGTPPTRAYMRDAASREAWDSAFGDGAAHRVAREAPDGVPDGAARRVPKPVASSQRPEAEERTKSARGRAPARPAASAVWPDVVAAFAEYGRKIDPTPSASRARAVERVERDFGAGAAVRAVHGYAAMHRRPSAGYDARTHHTPETVLRATNVAKYLEAETEARAAGNSPPFLPAATSAATSGTRADPRAPWLARIASGGVR